MGIVVVRGENNIMIANVNTTSYSWHWVGNQITIYLPHTHFDRRQKQLKLIVNVFILGS